MIVEIGGYYGDDRHVIDIDRIESVSMVQRGGGSKDNWTLEVLLSTQTFRIDFISYKDRCEVEYKNLLNALRQKSGELIIGDNK